MPKLNTKIVKYILQKCKQKVCYTYEKTKWYKLNLERKKNKRRDGPGRRKVPMGVFRHSMKGVREIFHFDLVFTFPPVNTNFNKRLLYLYVSRLQVLECQTCYTPKHER